MKVLQDSEGRTALLRCLWALCPTNLPCETLTSIFTGCDYIYDLNVVCTTRSCPADTDKTGETYQYKHSIVTLLDAWQQHAHLMGSRHALRCNISSPHPAPPNHFCNRCRADCGQETQTTDILVQVKSNFVGSTSVTAATLMAAASWNICLNDATRRSIGEADLCWYACRNCEKVAHA